MAFDHRPLYLQYKPYVGLWNGNVAPTQFYGPINITKLETTPIKQEDDEMISNIAGNVGETLESVPKPAESGTMNMEFTSMPSVLLNLVIGADQSALSQTTGGVTDKPVTTALNVWVPIGDKYISTTGITLKTAADAAVDAAKYAVDAVEGLIMATHADAVGSMKLSYTKETVAGESYEAGKAKYAYLQLRGPAYEKRTGTWGRLEILRASVSNSQAQDWVKGGWMAGTLSGKLITPIGYNAPINFEVRTA